MQRNTLIKRGAALAFGCLLVFVLYSALSMMLVDASSGPGVAADTPPWIPGPESVDDSGAVGPIGLTPAETAEHTLGDTGVDPAGTRPLRGTQSALSDQAYGEAPVYDGFWGVQNGRDPEIRDESGADPRPDQGEGEDFVFSGWGRSPGISGVSGPSLDLFESEATGSGDGHPNLDFPQPPDSAPVPEPGTMLLLGSGLILLAVFSRKRLLGHKAKPYNPSI